MKRSSLISAAVAFGIMFSSLEAGAACAFGLKKRSYVTEFTSFSQVFNSDGTIHSQGICFFSGLAKFDPALGENRLLLNGFNTCGLEVSPAESELTYTVNPNCTGSATSGGIIMNFAFDTKGDYGTFLVHFHGGHSTINAGKGTFVARK